MNGRRITLAFAFLMALAAGLAAGVLASRLPVGGRAVAGSHSQLAEQLQLTPEQSERMKGIWEGTRDSLDDCFASARTLQQERDDAIVAILTPDQRDKYVKINQDYVNRFADVTTRRQDAFQEAVRRTQQMLTESQKRKYDEILRSRMGQTGGLGPPGMGPEEGVAARHPAPRGGGSAVTPGRE